MIMVFLLARLGIHGIVTRPLTNFCARLKRIVRRPTVEIRLTMLGIPCTAEGAGIPNDGWQDMSDDQLARNATRMKAANVLIEEVSARASCAHG